MAKTRALEHQEIHQLFSGIEGTFALRNKTMLVCGIAMALRATELVKLNVGDVLASNGRIKTYITVRAETAKFNKSRRIRIGQPIRELLAAFIDNKRESGESLLPDAPLFVSRQGGHMTRQTLFLLLKKVFDKAGIDESPHCLRKTGGTLYYIESSYDIIATQEFLGHEDPATTKKYIGRDTKQIVAYSEKLAETLKNAMSGELNSNDQMLNSLKSYSNAELVMELAQRGFDINFLTEQMRKRELRASKVISIDAV